MTKVSTWKEGSFGFPTMTAQGQVPAFDSAPPTILVCSKNPHGVFSGVGGRGEGVVVTATGGAGVAGLGVLKSERHFIKLPNIDSETPEMK